MHLEIAAHIKWEKNLFRKKGLFKIQNIIVLGKLSTL